MSNIGNVANNREVVVLQTVQQILEIRLLLPVTQDVFYIVVITMYVLHTFTYIHNIYIYIYVQKKNLQIHPVSSCYIYIYIPTPRKGRLRRSTMPAARTRKEPVHRKGPKQAQEWETRKEQAKEQEQRKPSSHLTEGTAWKRLGKGYPKPPLAFPGAHIYIYIYIYIHNIT